MEPIFEDISGAGQALKLSRAMIYNLIASGELEKAHCGRKALITVKSIKAYAERLIASEEHSQRAPFQQPYRSEICGNYLDAMQARVDAEKPKDFKMTPISAAGWQATQEKFS